MLLTLADMIAAKIAESSRKELVDRSGLSDALWRKLEAGGNNAFPVPESIRGLALGLEVSEREVIIAASVGLGFDMEEDSPQLGRMLPKETDRLSSQSKRALIDTAKALIMAQFGEDLQEAEDVATQAKAVRKRVNASIMRRS